MGKENNKAIPTLEEYIAEQIATKRAAALDKSRNRTSVRVPMVPNHVTEEDWKHRINEAIKINEELLSKMMYEYNKSSNLYDIHDIERTQKRLDKLLEEKDKGYSKLIPGANCMYNAGDCYGLNIPGNQTFVAKHKELGFKKAPKGSMEPGDIVQDVKGGIPIHAMIYDSKNAEGTLLFNYARGNQYADFEHGYVKQGKYPLPIKDYDVYKYVGTPADSTQWINLYKQIYGMAKGGPLENESPSRNWDTTLTGKLINFSENPDSIGWDAKNRRWYAPPAGKGYDTNLFGMGVDRNLTPGFKERVKRDNKGREYLTVDDERYLRHMAIDRANESANTRYRFAQKASKIKGAVSPKHDAITVSAIYNLGPGHMARTVFENSKAMKSIFNRNSPEYQNHIHKLYKLKGRNERIQNELKFFKLNGL